LVGKTQFQYQNVGSLGALKLAVENGPYQNDTVAYNYDALGRVIGRSSVIALMGSQSRRAVMVRTAIPKQIPIGIMIMVSLTSMIGNVRAAVGRPLRMIVGRVGRHNLGTPEFQSKGKRRT
jgi:hypothetical protein